MPVANVIHSHRGVCSCCGSATACTRGDVVRDGRPVGKYLVKWTVGDPSHGMGWLVSFPESDSGRLIAVSLGYSFEHGAFMVRHVEDYSWTEDRVADYGEIIDRDRVIGTPLAERLFDLVDDVWLGDPYVRDFVELAKSHEH